MTSRSPAANGTTTVIIIPCWLSIALGVTPSTLLLPQVDYLGSTGVAAASLRNQEALPSSCGSGRRGNGRCASPSSPAGPHFKLTSDVSVLGRGYFKPGGANSRRSRVQPR